MKYFGFTFVETENGEIIREGEALYYTSAEVSYDEMKSVVKRVRDNPISMINILTFTEIEYDTFVIKGGNPNAL